MPKAKFYIKEVSDLKNRADSIFSPVFISFSAHFTLFSLFSVGRGVLGDFVWNEDAVAFERVVDESAWKATARSLHKCLGIKHIQEK